MKTDGFNSLQVHHCTSLPAFIQYWLDTTKPKHVFKFFYCSAMELYMITDFFTVQTLRPYYNNMSVDRVIVYDKCNHLTINSSNVLQWSITNRLYLHRTPMCYTKYYQYKKSILKQQNPMAQCNMYSRQCQRKHEKHNVIGLAKRYLFHKFNIPANKMM